MSKRNTDIVLNLIVDFHKKLHNNKPNFEQMFKEIQMMKFKIRPLQGDILALNFKDKKLLEALWNLGKLDELYQSKYHNLTKKQKELFYKFFDELYDKFQTQLNGIDIKGEEKILSAALEMEIFKEIEDKNKLN